MADETRQGGQCPWWGKKMLFQWPVFENGLVSLTTTIMNIDATINYRSRHFSSRPSFSRVQYVYLDKIVRPDRTPAVLLLWDPKNILF